MIAGPKRPGALPVKLGTPPVDGQEQYVVWFGATRFLNKAGEIVKTGVVMTEEEAARAAAPLEVTT